MWAEAASMVGQGMQEVEPMVEDAAASRVWGVE